MKNKASVFQLVGFGLNNSASNAQWFYLLIFFLVYCTDYLGLSPIIIGVMMTLFRVFAGITDPLIGFIIDKTDTKFGKFRPFMFIGTLIMNITFLLMFWGIKFDSNLKNYLFIILCYLVWDIGYACVTICTKGAQTVLTEDSAQRSLLSGVDTIGRIALDFIFMASGMIILNHFGGVKSGVAFRVFALITISITTFCSLCAILGIWKKDNREHYSVSKHTNLKIVDYISIFKNNKALKALVFSAASTKIALTTVSTVTFYFFTLVATAPDAQLKVNGPTVIIGVLSSVVAISLAIRYGRKKAYTLGAIFCIITLIIILLVRPFRPEQILLLVILCTLFNFGKNMTEAQTIPMIADVVDYEKYINGRFIPGMISTVFSFFDKIISSLAGLLVGFILQLTNYNAEIGLTPQLYVAIVFLYFGVPLIGYALATFGMRYYPIDKELYSRMHTGKM